MSFLRFEIDGVPSGNPRNWQDIEIVKSYFGENGLVSNLIEVIGEEYNNVLTEIENFVRVRVDRDKSKVSISINNIEFLFLKED